MSKLTKLRWSHLRQQWEEVKDRREIEFKPIDFVPPLEFDGREYDKWLMNMHLRMFWLPKTKEEGFFTPPSLL